MRIILVLPKFSQGGAERVAATLANGFSSDANVGIFVCCGSEPAPEEMDPRVEIHRSHSGNMLTSILPLSRYIRAFKPDIIISIMTLANNITLIANKLSGGYAKTVFTEHNNIRAQGVGLGWKGGVLRLTSMVTYQFADALVAVSNGVAKELVSYLHLQKNVRVIYNPMNIDNIRKKGINEIPDNPGDETLILAVGRLVEAKDFKTLILAFSQMNRQGRKLVIVGEGDERENLELLCRQLELMQYVHFAGRVDNPYSWFSRADLFVLSSAWEGFGNVLVEALAWNLPIVSTDCPHGPREILEDGRWGALVPIRDSDALATAMEDALKSSEPRKGFERASDFDARKVIPQYLSLFRELSPLDSR